MKVRYVVDREAEGNKDLWGSLVGREMNEPLDEKPGFSLMAMPRVSIAQVGQADCGEAIFDYRGFAEIKVYRSGYLTIETDDRVQMQKVNDNLMSVCHEKNIPLITTMGEHLRNYEKTKST
jgi:hypothetical protein